MDYSLLLEYGWVLLVLVVLEGVLAADNALVLAIMVKHLPEDQRKKALFYGLAGAFVFRFASLFIISFLVDVWQVQAIGALYLLYISINHIIRKTIKKKQGEEETDQNNSEKKGSGLWATVLKVEIADIAFAVDSILAAVALALTLSDTPIPDIGGLDGGKFLVVLGGGMIGLIIMRFAANAFVTLLHRKPGLEIAAFVIVGWVGIKLLVYTFAHPALGYIPEEFPHSTLWTVLFYAVLVTIALCGWFLTKDKEAAKDH
ncbi:TerC family protein [Bacillaceae bacterium Marseille-Q3522]|nr:TerC family protein [Bacillaceae bacterium Marseille-Q3522]